MEKYILFSLREDELEAKQQFEKEHPEISLQCYKENLSKENMNLITNEHVAVICSQVQPIPDEVYEHIAKQGVKVFSTRSAGFDMYNTALLKKHGIRITNVPSYSPESISEYAFGAALYFNRKLPLILDKVSEGDFRWQKPIMTKRIQDRVIGIVGTGHIGRVTASFFKKMGCKVLGYDLFPQKELTKDILEYVDLDTLLKESDIISLHMPATKDNHHLFNDETFNKMKDGSILINTARGSIVDAKALIKALDNHKLSGAVIDTYEFEMDYVPKDNRNKEIKDEVLKTMIARNDILWTPHIAFYTDAAVKALFETALLSAYDIVTKNESKNEVLVK